MIAGGLPHSDVDFLVGVLLSSFDVFFFFNDTATTEIYTLSLHDALPISRARPRWFGVRRRGVQPARPWAGAGQRRPRSEEHTSELQSPCNLVCRLLLEKKNIAHLIPSSIGACELLG